MAQTLMPWWAWFLVGWFAVSAPIALVVGLVLGQLNN